ncbi:H-NS family nucleoid-associated regulatory protein [Achromobacter sp. DH1f]|uniref:H-NS histone family protein n=1 Tax=Achromobacter sp. DH1f TaxID=1397275 RepID=UPI0009DE7F5F|nr:H-NS histone family protein [Achromobacter sp. DH1f]
MTQDELNEILDQIRQLEALNRRIKNLRRVGRIEALEIVAELLHKHRLTPRELRSLFSTSRTVLKPLNRTRTGPKTKVAPKYRHPGTGESWAGRGRPPRWLVAAVAEGADRDSFLIANQEKCAADLANEDGYYTSQVADFPSPL